MERYGETVIALMITSGYGPRSEVLRGIYYDPIKLKNAEGWLTERSDSNERREERLETLEWAILLFVFLGVVADFVLVAPRVGQFLREAIAYLTTRFG